MDREVVLATLLAGVATMLCGMAMPRDATWRGCGATRERFGFRRLVLPLAPAVVLLAAVFGFTLVEPEAVEAAEVVPPSAMALAQVLGCVAVRAVVRAVASLSAGHETQTAVTVGLWRPRVCLHDAFVRGLAPGGLWAVQMHEAAHVRHRDPLRIWFAQLIADLQWPIPGARERFGAWLHALELARDDEARALGVDGAELASAIVKAARVERTPGRSLARLTGDAARLKERVERLLAPPPAPEIRLASHHVHALAFPAALVVAVPCGATFGDAIVLDVLGWTLWLAGRSR